MKTTHKFHPMRERYHYDFGPCSADAGFAQVDTGQDASYFGIWANPETLTVVEFMEGDEYTREFDSAEEFAAHLRHIRDWNEEQGHGFHGIDCLCRSSIVKAFAGLDLCLETLFH